MGTTLPEPAPPTIGRPTDDCLERSPKVDSVNEPASDPSETQRRSSSPARTERESPTFGLRLSRVLVGRDDLLELADRRLAEAHAGDGRLLLLAGEAGIGKTRLVGAIEDRALGMGFRAIRGRTSPEDAAVAAAPFLDLGRTMSRVDPFAAVGAELEARLVEIEPGQRGDSRRRRRLLVLDVVDLLASIAPQPTFLALENLTYADDLSLEILAGLAHRLRGLPLLVVATYRSDELYPRVPMREWRARLITERLAEEARLRRLSLEETAYMASQILGWTVPPRAMWSPPSSNAPTGSRCMSRSCSASSSRATGRVATPFARPTCPTRCRRRFTSGYAACLDRHGTLFWPRR